MRQVELPAEMRCRSCEQRVENALRSLEGVLSVATDLKRQRVEVEFNERSIDEAEVGAAVARAATHGLGG